MAGPISNGHDHTRKPGWDALARPGERVGQQRLLRPSKSSPSPKAPLREMGHPDSIFADEATGIRGNGHAAAFQVNLTSPWPKAGLAIPQKDKRQCYEED